MQGDLKGNVIPRRTIFRPVNGGQASHATRTTSGCCCRRAQAWGANRPAARRPRWTCWPSPLRRMRRPPSASSATTANSTPSATGRPFPVRPASAARTAPPPRLRHGRHRRARPQLAPGGLPASALRHPRQDRGSACPRAGNPVRFPRGDDLRQASSDARPPRRAGPPRPPRFPRPLRAGRLMP